MSVALALVLLGVAGLSAWTVARVAAGPGADQVRGFCSVGAAAATVVAFGVLGIGWWWDSRIADLVAIIALFALVVYYLAALVIGFRTRVGPLRR